MSGLVILAVALLGGAGAVARLLTDARVSDRLPMTFPAGTFAVNISGSLALGVLAGATADADTLRLLAIGFLGSFTTFSTWMYETNRLAEDGEAAPATANVAVSLITGLLAAWIGLRIGGLL